MGRFLAIGLTYEASILCSHIHRAKVTVADVLDEMQTSLGYDIGMYDVVEHNEYVKFALKKEVLQNGLYAFLKEFYTVIYKDTSSVYSRDYKQILDLLEKGEFDECINLAKAGENMTFRFDDYAEAQIMYVGKSVKKSVCVYTTMLNIYYGEGKIFTEGMTDIERIFDYCVRNLFKDKLVAQSVRLYISG